MPESSLQLLSGHRKPILPGEVWEMPPIISREGPKASARVIDFFAGQLRNQNTRRAYVHAISEFLRCAQDRGYPLGKIPPGFIGAYLDSMGAAAPTQKQHLAALRAFFDWLVTGQIVELNPAASVRGPKLVVRQGKTPVLPEGELRQLFASIPAVSLRDLRDRALLGTFLYTFARVSAVVGMQVCDYRVSGRRAEIELKEKGGVVNKVPVHHKLREFLEEYIEATKLAADPHSWLWRSMPGKKDGILKTRISRRDALEIVKRRCLAATLPSDICCHSFRGSGITLYLQKGGSLEHAQKIAAHADPRTTRLYDRTGEAISLDEVERIVF